jgi:lysozyme
MVSNDLIRFLRSWEGEELEAYLDSAKIPTIGCGHTGLVDGRPVRLGMKITRRKSRELLELDLLAHEHFVRTLVPRRWRKLPRRREALISASFNLGPQILTSSAPLVSVGKALQAKSVNRRTVDKLCDALELFVFADGERLEGLERRRAAEVHLIKTGKYRLNR